MNLIGIFILTALIFEFVLHRLSEALNLRSASATVPDSFKDLYDSKRYARAQDYLKVRTRFAWISSGVFLAATLAFWLVGGFGLLDDGVRSLGHGPILSGLIYVGALWIGRSILALAFQAYTVFVIADRFAVETTNDRNALVSALKKLSADNLSNLSPHPLHVALSYSHPPIQQRIRSIENIPAASRVSIETPDRGRKN